MDLESLAFDKTLGNILNRISNYIVKCKLNFLSAHVDLSLFNFIKIYDLFLFEVGVIDAEAILVLCQKQSLKEFIELQCLICFENSGKVHKFTCLDNVYAEANIEEDNLPPNMTYILQVISIFLIINVNYTINACRY